MPNSNIAAAKEASPKDNSSARIPEKALRVVPRSRRSLANLSQILPEELFLAMVCMERKRAERSSKKFALALLDAEDVPKDSHYAKILRGLVRASASVRRETDLAGWYKQHAILGIVFTELGTLDDATTGATLMNKVHEALKKELSPAERSRVHVSLHIFSEDKTSQDPDLPTNIPLYPDLFHREDSQKVPFLAKRLMDIVGSAIALLLFSPLLLLSAIAVKWGSKGPVFFRQERLGQFGKTFTCLKFRSMHAANDPKIHQEFMKRLIGGSVEGKDEAGDKPVYKMKDDPRITRAGRFLRRTSLDELPQFINVLLGDMSLVGPRPPLAYEYEEYDVWHRRRVLEIKPGITGLWQVKGRSRVSFDDMVRLDLQYVRRWSLWLDIQILLETPRAVLLGDGAY